MKSPDRIKHYQLTPSQAQAMGQQILALLAMYEKNKLPLPGTSSLILSLPLSELTSISFTTISFCVDELQNTFDVFHAVWLLHTALSFSTYTLRLMLPVYCVMAVKACIPQASTFIMCVKPSLPTLSLSLKDVASVPCSSPIS